MAQNSKSRCAVVD